MVIEQPTFKKATGKIHQKNKFSVIFSQTMKCVKSSGKFVKMKIFVPTPDIVNF